jgi:hypothetical protein
MQTESSDHFAAAKTGDAQGSAVEILDHPMPFQRDSEQSRPQCSADMGPPLAPIEAGTREAAPRSPRFTRTMFGRLSRSTEGS